MRSVTRTATILLLVSALLLFPSCDEKKAQTFLGEILAPLLPVVAQAIIDDPKVKELMGEGGEPLAQAAWIVAKPALQNAISSLASGDADEKLAYKRIMKESPDIAAIFYRLNEDGIPGGLWPRLDSWLKLKGYTAGASGLWRELTDAKLKVTITDEDLEELEGLMGTAVIEEFLAVQNEHKHYSLPDFEEE